MESESEYDFSGDEESEDVEDIEEIQFNPPHQKRRRRNASRRNRAEHSDEEDCDDAMGNSSTSRSGSDDRVIALEEENMALKKRVKELEKMVKSLQKSNTNTAANAPRSTVNGKKQFTAFAKALKRTAKLKKTKFHGSGDITVESLMDYDDFNALFDGKGTKIQPTPNNKPRSIKTIIEFRDWNAVKELFDAYEVEIDQEIDVSYWSMGSIHRGKGRYMGTTTGKVQSLTVEFNKSKRSLKLNYYVSSGCGFF